MAIKLEKRSGKRPIFYGWWIVLSAFISNFVNVGTSGYALTVMLLPMQEAFGVTRGIISLAPVARNLSSAFFAPLLGSHMDKPGRARTIMMGGAITGCLSLVLTGVSNSVWFFLLAYGILGGLTMVSAGNMMGNVLLAKWFIKKRARATSLSAMGIALGGVVMVPITTLILGSVGWRWTWVILGISGLLILLPLAFFVVKTEPEQVGMKPDGETDETTPNKGPISAIQEVQWTRAEAIRTPTFWILNVVTGMIIAIGGGVMLHLSAFLQDDGFSRGMASTAVTVFSLGSLCSYTFWGYLLDRVPPRVLIILAHALLASGIAIMLYTNSAIAIQIGAFMYGWGFGASPITRVIWANYYGRRLQGSIQGIVMPFSLFATMSGPLIGGFLHDITGDYMTAFNIFIGMGISASILALFAVPPKKKLSQI